jgi:hypothetical protein
MRIDVNNLMKSLLPFAAFALVQVPIADSSLAGQQAIKQKSACAHVGGKVGANPYSDGTYPYLCVYPDKYDRQCQGELDETAYYDVEARKCVSELLCDLEGIC